MISVQRGARVTPAESRASLCFDMIAEIGLRSYIVFRSRLGARLIRASGW